MGLFYFDFFKNMFSKTQTIQDFRTHEKDTGSAEVQIAILTERIKYLTSHLRQNKKDNQTTLSLIKMSSQRNKLFKYLKSCNKENIIADLKSKLNLK